MKILFALAVFTLVILLTEGKLDASIILYDLFYSQVK